MCLAGGGVVEGLGMNQHVWDGQGLKYPCLFGTFFQNHKILEKSIFDEAETGFMENIKED
jgi:hypothetical protein